jgi:carnosine N-methyltransferase
MYSVEANECSGVMVHAMHTMLTKILPDYAANSSQVTKFYPFLHFDLVDEWDFTNRSIPSFFPTRDAISIVDWIRRIPAQSTKGGSFTVQYGDFLSAYGDKSKHESFDIIVTCFFIDTFANILEPLAVIQHILKPGGLWINAGPLHYHGKPAIPYSYAQLERIILSLSFSKVEDSTITSHYYGESSNFMKPQLYNFPLSAWRKHSDDDVMSRRNQTQVTPSLIQEMFLKAKSRGNYAASSTTDSEVTSNKFTSNFK